MALDFDEIKSDISEIIAIGDEALASSKLIALQDKIANDISQSVAETNKLNETIKGLNDEIEKQKNENELIRANNKDLLLRYGQLVTETQSVIKPVEQEEENPEANMSWSDIAGME